MTERLSTRRPRPQLSKLNANLRVALDEIDVPGSRMPRSKSPRATQHAARSPTRVESSSSPTARRRSTARRGQRARESRRCLEVTTPGDDNRIALDRAEGLLRASSSPCATNGRGRGLATISDRESSSSFRGRPRRPRELVAGQRSRPVVFRAGDRARARGRVVLDSHPPPPPGETDFPSSTAPPPQAAKAAPVGVTDEVMPAATDLPEPPRHERVLIRRRRLGKKHNRDGLALTEARRARSTSENRRALRRRSREGDGLLLLARPLLLDIQPAERNASRCCVALRAADHLVPVIVASARDGEFDTVAALPSRRDY